MGVLTRSVAIGLIRRFHNCSLNCWTITHCWITPNASLACSSTVELSTFVHQRRPKMLMLALLGVSFSKSVPKGLYLSQTTCARSWSVGLSVEWHKWWTRMYRSHAAVILKPWIRLMCRAISDCYSPTWRRPIAMFPFLLHEWVAACRYSGL